MILIGIIFDLGGLHITHTDTDIIHRYNIYIYIGTDIEIDNMLQVIVSYKEQ